MDTISVVSGTLLFPHKNPHKVLKSESTSLRSRTMPLGAKLHSTERNVHDARPSTFYQSLSSFKMLLPQTGCKLRQHNGKWITKAWHNKVSPVSFWDWLTMLRLRKALRYFHFHEQNSTEQIFSPSVYSEIQKLPEYCM